MKHLVGIVSIVGFVGGFFACATTTDVYGECSEIEDCYTDINMQPDGSVCDPSRHCVCPKGTRACCPKDAPVESCGEACLPEDQCAGGADAGADSSSSVECTADTDCPQPPSRECGKGSCIAGVCELKINVGPTASQVYGDCARRECDTGGVLVEAGDSSDIYNDGKECTFDGCNNGKPHNILAADGSPCIESGQGYCYQGSCVQCIAILQFTSCGNGLVCDSIWCEPFQQCMNQGCGGVCAPCVVGYPCAQDSDCISSSCMGNKCQLPTCIDGRKNGSETGLDCGSGSCDPCPAGQGCTLPDDCQSSVCKIGKCQAPTCLDGKPNGGESETDCGGPCKACL